MRRILHDMSESRFLSHLQIPLVASTMKSSWMQVPGSNGKCLLYCCLMRTLSAVAQCPLFLDCLTERTPACFPTPYSQYFPKWAPLCSWPMIFWGLLEQMLRALYSKGVGGPEAPVSRQMDNWRAFGCSVETTLLITIWIKLITSCPPYISSSFWILYFC